MRGSSLAARAAFVLMIALAPAANAERNEAPLPWQKSKQHNSEKDKPEKRKPEPPKPDQPKPVRSKPEQPNPEPSKPEQPKLERPARAPQAQQPSRQPSQAQLPNSDLYRWQLLAQWPISFPDIDAAKQLYGASSFYPQDFTVDEARSLAFINYNPNNDPNEIGQLIVVRRWPGGDYVSSFSVGPSAGWLWIERRDGRTLLVKRLGARGMGKWDITQLPRNLSSIEPVARYDGRVTDAYVYGTYRKGVATINSFSDPSGNTRQLTFFKQFDESFREKGSVRFSKKQMGALDETGKDLPHVQGFQDAGSYFFVTVGGIYKPSAPPSPGQIMGVWILTKSGETSSEGLLSPDKFLSILQQNGIRSNRIEGEGAWVSSNGTPYSMWVNLWNKPETDQSGLLIFRHFGKGGIDFSPAAVDADTGGK